jgi:hypothetical protein
VGECHGQKGATAAIGYLDLFAGKGRFEDGSDSTPLLLLKSALACPALLPHVKMAFNDKDAAVIASIQEATSA